MIVACICAALLVVVCFGEWFAFAILYYFARNNEQAAAPLAEGLEPSIQDVPKPEVEQVTEQPATRTEAHPVFNPDEDWL